MVLVYLQTRKKSVIMRSTVQKEMYQSQTLAVFFSWKSSGLVICGLLLQEANHTFYGYNFNLELSFL